MYGERRSFGGGGSRFGGGGRRFGGGGGSRGDVGEKPVKEGETYDVEITEVGSRGDGIAKIQNFVIFVAGTQKGDKVKIKITQVKPKNAVGEVVGKAGEAAPAGGSETVKEIAEEAESEGAELEHEAASEVEAEETSEETE